MSKKNVTRGQGPEQVVSPAVLESVLVSGPVSGCVSGDEELQEYAA